MLGYEIDSKLPNYHEAPRRIKKSSDILKFIYSEKATKFVEILPLLLTTVHTVKSKGKILPNFVAFSEYMNFKTKYRVVELRVKNLISRS